MKLRPRAKVRADLISCGIPIEEAEVLCDGATLSSVSTPTAGAWVKTSPQCDIVISVAAQEMLFAKAIIPMVANVVRIINKLDVVAAYGSSPGWEDIDPKIRAMLVDWIYRGDFTPETRKDIMPAVVKNSVSDLADVVEDRELWRLVPPDRFHRRVAYFKNQEASRVTPI